ncbi:hypothetical protein GCM10027019_01390 [Melaminivora jejuensis]|uniref:hypothetical protein n=1 Tax=Melaminivora jejuensis TaxID=1267217 RepID=UPI001ADEE221|nr:hypothetical protein [Melaminivora jejuensis]UHJ66154.1 hypothetical protein LVC68_06475 [Melaminivora jejuensis]
MQQKTSPSGQSGQTDHHGATLHGQVHYREGDGPQLTIPAGRVELYPAADSVIVRWTTPDDSAGQAALTHAQYQQYVQAGQIVPARQGQR